MDKQQMCEYLEKEKPVLTNLSDRIWEYAETVFEEFRPATLIQDVLKNRGFTVEAPIGKTKTAFRGTYGSGRSVIGILVESDALNDLSQKVHSVVQQSLVHSGNDHGYGRNLFAGGLVDVALAIKVYLEASYLPGTTKLFDCPDEEGGSGKAFMAWEGVFQGIDVAPAWHPMEVNATSNTKSLANYQVLYTSRDKVAYAATALYLGRSTLDTVELMDVGVNYLRKHVISDAHIYYAITDPDRLSPSVVQSSASVLYLIRTSKTSRIEEIY